MTDATTSPGADGASVEAAAVTPTHPRYDFRRPRLVSTDKRRTIESMHERLGSALEAWLTGRLRTPVPVTVADVSVSTFAHFTGSLAPACSCFGFGIANAEPNEGVIEIHGELAYLLVDRFFGGDAHPTVMERGLTLVERLAVRTVVERILLHLAEVWHEYVPLQLALTSFESDPGMVQHMRREDEILVATFALEIDGMKSGFRICLPLAAIERFFNAGDRRRARRDGRAQHDKATTDLTEATVRKMRVEVTVRMPAFAVPMRQLMELRTGAVLTTGLQTDTALDVFVSGTPRYRATPGRVSGRVGVRVLDALQAGPIELDLPTFIQQGVTR